jgi:hypothetical protein
VETHSLLEPRQRTSSLGSTVSGPSPLDNRCTTGVQGLSVKAIIVTIVEPAPNLSEGSRSIPPGAPRSGMDRQTVPIPLTGARY